MQLAGKKTTVTGKNTCVPEARLRFSGLQEAQSERKTATKRLIEAKSSTKAGIFSEGNLPHRLVSVPNFVGKVG